MAWDQSDSIAAAAVVVAAVSAFYSWRSYEYTKDNYNLNAGRDQREQLSKEPSIDFRITKPKGGSPWGWDRFQIVLTVINRGDRNIEPWDIRIVEPAHLAFAVVPPGSPETKVESSKILKSIHADIGTIPPGKSGSQILMTAVALPVFEKGKGFGLTHHDLRFEDYFPMEMTFEVSVFFADEREASKTFKITRSVRWETPPPNLKSKARNQIPPAETKDPYSIFVFP